MTDKKCKNCQFFDPWKNPSAFKEGRCRANPPQIGRSGGSWPEVKADKDWCGKFTQRPHGEPDND